MTPWRTSTLVLPLIAAALCTSAGHAQQKRGTHLSDSAAVPPATTPADRLLLGYRLADYARTTKDARAMMVAARIVGTVATRTGTDQGKLAVKGSRNPVGKIEATSASDLYAQARQYAGGDATLLGEIDAAQAEASRDVLGAGGAMRTVEYVPAGATWTVKFMARGGVPLVVGARRDSATAVDLKLLDENGGTICQDMSHNVTMYCRYNPLWMGPVSIQVVNHGDGGTGVALIGN